MATLFDALGSMLDGDGVAQLSRRIGADEAQTRTALAGALPMLVAALGRNAQSGAGAASLLAALDRNHDGSILDDVAGYLGQADPAQGQRMLDHVLGTRQGAAESTIGRMSGLDTAQMQQLMALVVPVVLGLLGRTQRTRGLDAGGLTDMLGTQQNEATQAAPDVMSMVGSVLDGNRDGQVMDDVVRIGTSFLGSLFGQRR
jgi:hypothetical protein